jgi:hypothetical protein
VSGSLSGRLRGWIYSQDSHKGCLGVEDSKRTPTGRPFILLLNAVRPVLSATRHSDKPPDAIIQPILFNISNDKPASIAVVGVEHNIPATRYSNAWHHKGK